MNSLYRILSLFSLPMLSAMLCFSQSQPPQTAATSTANNASTSSTSTAVPENGSGPSVNVKDPKALSLIGTAITAMGDPSGSVQDFTATGDITYYWAGKEEKGSATIEGKGADQLRFDSALANGTRSWVVHGGTGNIRDVDGKVRSIPFHNAVVLGNLIFPLGRLKALNSDASTSVSYAGLSTIENQSFDDISVHKQLFQTDPDGAGNRLMDADFYFDPASHMLIGVHDQTHPTRSMTANIPHAIYFSDYRPVSGILVPFSVSEYVGGQRVWSLQITNVTFNTGLTDSNFQLQ